ATPATRTPTYGGEAARVRRSPSPPTPPSPSPPPRPAVAPTPRGARSSASCSGYSRPSRAHIRRRRCPGPPLAVSSDSSKPLASSSTGGNADPDEEPVLPLLQELAV